MSIKQVQAALFVLLLGLAMRPAGAQRYTVTDLGSLGGAFMDAHALNAAGEVAGAGTLAGEWVSHAWRWRNGVQQDLGTLGGASSLAYGINAAGQVVGQSALPASDASHAFLWDGDRLRDLGTLGGQFSFAYGINDHGHVVGFSTLEGEPQWQPPWLGGRSTAMEHAFLWDGETMRDLGTLGGSQSAAHGINDAGQVVGSAYRAGDQVQRAFLWAEGEMRDLGTLGGTGSAALAINAAGWVVGGAQIEGDAASHAFLWDGETMRDLGTLGGRSSTAYGINGRGDVVGNAQGAGQELRAFLYRDGVMRDLNELIPPETGWVLYAARAINDAGQIAGSGTFEGRSRAFLLQPAPVGAPTGLAASVVAGPAVRLEWTDQSENESGFAVWRRSGGGEFALVAEVGTDETGFTDRGLRPGTTYTYRVHALLPDGASAGSNEADGVTPPLPPAPAAVWSNGKTATTVGVAWADSSSDETAFALWRRQGAGAWERVAVLSAGVTASMDRGLAPETAYTYRVRAINLSGASGWSPELTVATLPLPPSTPTGLRAEAQAIGEIRVTWTDNSHTETAFALWRRAGDGEFVRLAVLAPNRTGYVDREVTAGVAYTYRVRAVGVGGASGWSAEVRVSE